MILTTKEHNENYRSVRIKAETYKNIKLLSVEMEIPITKLIELMYVFYTDKKVK